MNQKVGRVLADRVAVVTGGGDGIGGGISALFAAAGARVLVVDIDAEAAERTVAAIGGAGGQASAHIADVRDAAAVAGMAQTAQTFGGGRVDVLVNNVGHYVKAGVFAESSEEDWEALYAINLLHVLRCTRAFLPGMLERERGAIVNLSTVEAFRGIPTCAVYSAFKAGVSQFTKSLALEVAPHGVRVNAIAPDVTQTPQVPYDQWVSAEEQAMIPSWVPIGRFGTPNDAAQVALFLASDAAGFVTGHTIPTDGGTLAAGGWYKLRGRDQWTNRPRQP
jgi:NAD(P)-dependent dehydrogenase (short-subunit alcohol dehydrogenase family)